MILDLSRFRMCRVSAVSLCLSLLHVVTLSADQIELSVPLQIEIQPLTEAEQSVYDIDNAKILEYLELHIENAETCLNEALSKTEAGLNYRFNVFQKGFKWASEESISRKGKHVWAPDVDETGEYLLPPLGKEAEEFEVSFYDFPAFSVFPALSVELVSSPGYQRIIEIGNRIEEIKLAGADGNPMTRDQYSDLYEEHQWLSREAGGIFAQLQSETRLLDQYGPSNQIRLDRELLFARPNYPRERSNVLPHEILHAYAGFRDMYNDLSNTAPNIMGNTDYDVECVFTESQVQSMLRYRGL